VQLGLWGEHAASASGETSAMLKQLLLHLVLTILVEAHNLQCNI